MATTSSRSRSRGPVFPVSSAFQRSISPSGRFSSPSSSGAIVSAFASSSASFSSQTPSFFHRSSSPTRVNLVGATHMAPSVRFATSPTRRHLTVDHQVVKKPISNTGSTARRTCLCSPTTHPGSFRCSIHKGFQLHHSQQSVSHAFSSPSNRLNARRSAMTNSLVRIGTVEGDWVKRALAALIRPSSHQQRRRAAFQPRPSRLSIMTTASDES
ncbi:uncharacterized protein LOC120254258 [Dioscorea cayenensis subsp. rotundata]|uniref:Uncharacterized protein LOC120254258 n=1 Tax=Dioscorea cayennensis subsp. rotundata TaxID=55577 RepID=A0AB40ATD5_DIOCR|nr:uncharacterized protein LOC120254258 [Dioscorea cayenensis subsp. rotundata]